jgi:hypothetical protein
MKPHCLWANSRWRKAIFFLGAALLVLNLLEFPRHVYNVLHDLSLQGTYEYYAAKDFQFGAQVYQNVGPYGYAHYAYSYVGILPIQKMVLKNLSRLGLLFLVIWLSRRLPQIGMKLWWWAAWFIFQPFTWPLRVYPDSDLLVYPEMEWDQDYAYLTIYLAALYLLQRPKDWVFHLASSGLLLLLAFTAQTKHTAFVLAVCAVGAVSLQSLLRKAIWPALRSLLLFGCFSIVLWLLAGQALANLPGYIRGIAAYSSGYNEAQVIEPRPETALAGALILALLCLRSAYNGLALKQGIARTLFEISSLFVMWKHGFVRADYDHLAVFFFGAALFAVPLFCVPSGPEAVVVTPRFQWLRWLGYRSAIVAGVAGVALVILATNGAQPDQTPGKGGYHPGYLWNRLANNFRWLISPQRQMAKMNTDLGKVEACFSLPRMKAKVAQAKVDYFGALPGWVLLNHLNYWSRPMPSDFCAWNPALEQANEAFYRDPHTAPPYVICSIVPIQRLLVQNDPLALRALLDNYHPVLLEDDRLLLETNAPPLRDRAEKKLLAEFSTQFDTPISLADWGDMVWVEADITHSVLGKLRALFYQPRPCYIAYRFLGDAESRSARFLTSIGGGGCLLNPFIGGVQDLIKFYRPGEDLASLRKVESFGFFCDPGDEKYFQKNLRVRLYAVNRPTERVTLAEAGQR